MSGRFPRVIARQVIRVLERRGFRLARQKGSHMISMNEAGARVTVPYHANKIVRPKVLKSILEEAGISTEEFKRLLK